MAGQPVSGPIPAPGFHATQGAASWAARRRSPSRRSTGRALSGSPLSGFVSSSGTRCLQKGLDIGNEINTGILTFRPGARIRKTPTEIRDSASRVIIDIPLDQDRKHSVKIFFKREAPIDEPQVLNPGDLLQEKHELYSG